MNEAKYEDLHYETRGGRFDPNTGRFSLLPLGKVGTIPKKRLKEFIEDMERRSNAYWHGD